MDTFGGIIEKWTGEFMSFGEIDRETIEGDVFSFTFPLNFMQSLQSVIKKLI